MKLCYLSEATYPHTIKWSNFFKSKGYDIVVISLKRGKIPGIKTYNLDDKDYKHRNNISKLLFLLKLNKIKEIIEIEKPDIVHAHYATSYGLLGSLLNFHPYILSVWGTDIYKFPTISPLHKALLKYNLSKPDIILSTSRDMAEETKKYTDKEIKITPFGVDLDLFYPEPDLKAKDKIIIGTIKSLEDRYGIDYLIKAFALVKDKIKDIDIELHIGGKGDKEGKLRKIVNKLGLEKDVKFLGYIQEEKVRNVFNTFDIAVFPSIYESFGVAAVEAQACKIPVIASDVGGLPEATNPNKSSLLVPPRDIEALAQAMIKLVKDQDLRQELGKNGRIYVQENFNIEDNLNLAHKIYQSFL